MKVCSLFSGIGGFDIALIRQGHEIIYANEWNKYAAQIYNKNFKERKSPLLDTRDITTVKAEEIPDHDLLVGGFPCQAFSVAGKRLGFDDTRGTLFFEIARILQHHQPNFAILENVKGLISHDGGKTIEVILETLQELGYYVNMEIYNSKSYGVPQNRERVFLICRHIKTLIKDGESQKFNTSKQIIKEYLFQILLNNLVEVKKLQEERSKDWVLGWIFLKEILKSGAKLKIKSLKQTLTYLEKNCKNSSHVEASCQSLIEDSCMEGENIKDGILMVMEEKKSILKTEDVYTSIAILLNNKLVESSQDKTQSTISTVIKQIIDSKIYTFTTLSQAIGLAIIQLRSLSPGCWKEILLNLTLMREHTKKYARYNNIQEKEITITETGNAYLSSNVQDNATHFVTGHLRGTPRPQVFPIGEDGNQADELPRHIANILTRRYEGAQATGTYIGEGKQYAQGKSGRQGIQQEGDKPDNTDSRRGKAHTADIGNEQEIIGSTQKHASRMKNQSKALTEAMGKGGGHVPMLMAYSSSQRKDHVEHRIKEGEANCLTTGKGCAGGMKSMSFVKEEMKIRRLTPVECERLQGFPDNWTKYGADGELISDTQRYKMCGNAVTTNVITTIAKRLMEPSL